MFTKILRVTVLVGVLAGLMSGCLSVEKKVYSFKIKPDGSGEGDIKFVNIVSMEDNDKDVSFKDFAELVTDYLQGTKFEDDFPAMRVTDKQLYVENGVLVGEVKFTFGTADSIGFFRPGKKDCAPLMYFVKTTSSQETVVESNGQVVTDVSDSPFLLWDSGAKECTFTTTLMSDTSGAHNLAAEYNNWKGKK